MSAEVRIGSLAPGDWFMWHDAYPLCCVMPDPETDRYSEVVVYWDQTDAPRSWECTPRVLVQRATPSDADKRLFTEWLLKNPAQSL